MEIKGKGSCICQEGLVIKLKHAMGGCTCISFGLTRSLLVKAKLHVDLNLQVNHGLRLGKIIHDVFPFSRQR